MASRQMTQTSGDAGSVSGLVISCSWKKVFKPVGSVDGRSSMVVLALEIASVGLLDAATLCCVLGAATLCCVGIPHSCDVDDWGVL